MIRDVGDQMTLRTVLTDAAGVLNNTAVGALLVTKPDGSTTTPTVTNTGSGGLYTASVTPDQAGLWIYRFTFSGSVVTVQGDQFTVVTAGRALVASMEEARAQLRRTDTTDDQAIRSYLVSATDVVEKLVGGPLSVQTFTETLTVQGDRIAPLHQPLVSVTSLTPDLASVLDPSAYIVDTTLGIVRLRWSWYGAQPYPWTIVYRAGYSTIPERVKTAGLMIFQWLWLVENGGSGLPYPGQEADTVPVAGYTIPRRAFQMLDGEMSIGIA